MLIVIVLLRILLFWLFYFVPWTVFVNVWVYTCHTILASFDCGMFRELFAQAFIPAWFIFPSWFFCLSFLIVNKTRYLVFESTFFDFICKGLTKTGSSWRCGYCRSAAKPSVPSLHTFVLPTISPQLEVMAQNSQCWWVCIFFLPQSILYPNPFCSSS